MAEVSWSLKAEADLQAIEEYIAKDSDLRAVALVDRLVEAVERLIDSPKIGRIVPEFGREDLREVVCRGYRLVYLVSGDSVTILRVVHGARDLRGMAIREPWDLP